MAIFALAHEDGEGFVRLGTSPSSPRPPLPPSTVPLPSSLPTMGLFSSPDPNKAPPQKIQWSDDNLDEYTQSCVPLSELISLPLAQTDQRLAPFSQSFDPNPMPKHVPHVNELGITSAPMLSASFHLVKFCKDYTGQLTSPRASSLLPCISLKLRPSPYMTDDFLLCRAENENPEHCLKEGRRVTRCATDLCVSRLKLHLASEEGPRGAQPGETPQLTLPADLSSPPLPLLAC